jgi:hypothetical protein
MLVWRDPFGLHFETRLPGVPNWPSVSYLLSVADDLRAHLSSPGVPNTQEGIIDRIASHLISSS